MTHILEVSPYNHESDYICKACGMEIRRAAPSVDGFLVRTNSNDSWKLKEIEPCAAIRMEDALS